MLALEYKQVELDYCNSCGGVWFDDTELELLMQIMNLDENDIILKNLLNLEEADLPGTGRECSVPSVTGV